MRCHCRHSTQTCDGDGDGNGRIEVPTGSNERYRFWQHLANAGLMEGSYSGISGTASPQHSLSTNSPSSKLSSGQWFVTWGGTLAGSNSAADAHFAGDWGNYMELGAPYTNFHPITPIVKPEEMWNIDTKMDDGMPARGKVVARRWDTCTNATSETNTTAQYLLSSQTVGCVITFWNVF